MTEKTNKNDMLVEAEEKIQVTNRYGKTGHNRVIPESRCIFRIFDPADALCSGINSCEVCRGDRQYFISRKLAAQSMLETEYTSADVIPVDEFEALSGVRYSIVRPYILPLVDRDAPEGNVLRWLRQNGIEPDPDDIRVQFTFIWGIDVDGMPRSGILVKLDSSLNDDRWDYITIEPNRPSMNYLASLSSCETVVDIVAALGLDVTYLSRNPFWTPLSKKEKALAQQEAQDKGRLF